MTYIFLVLIILVFMFIKKTGKDISNYSTNLIANGDAIRSNKSTSPEHFKSCNINSFTSDCRSFYGSNKTRSGSFQYLSRHKK